MRRIEKTIHGARAPTRFSKCTWRNPLALHSSAARATSSPPKRRPTALYPGRASPPPSRLLRTRHEPGSRYPHHRTRLRGHRMIPNSSTPSPPRPLQPWPRTGPGWRGQPATPSLERPSASIPLGLLRSLAARRNPCPPGVRGARPSSKPWPRRSNRAVLPLSPPRSAASRSCGIGRPRRRCPGSLRDPHRGLRGECVDDRDADGSGVPRDVIFGRRGHGRCAAV